MSPYSRTRLIVLRERLMTMWGGPTHDRVEEFHVLRMMQGILEAERKTHPLPLSMEVWN